MNGLAFSKNGLRLVAGVGQEHRLGRWWRDAEARNSLWIIDFKPAGQEDEDDDDDDDDSSDGDDSSSSGDSE